MHKKLRASLHIMVSGRSFLYIARFDSEGKNPKDRVYWLSPKNLDLIYKIVGKQKMVNTLYNGVRGLNLTWYPV